MIILTIRTDNPEAEIGLYNDYKQLSYIAWHAHRQLSETIHTKIKELLTRQSLDWKKIDGIIGFEGPGSFTGLRIGLTVANTLADSLNIPIVAAEGKMWQHTGLNRLLSGNNDKIVSPQYGFQPNTTQQRK